MHSHNERERGEGETDRQTDRRTDGPTGRERERALFILANLVKKKEKEWQWVKEKGWRGGIMSLASRIHGQYK